MALENILAKIKKEAGLSADDILKEAEAEAKKREVLCEGDISKIESESAKEKARIDNDIKNAHLLPAKLTVRGMILSSERNILDSAFDEIFNFDENNYKAVLSYLAEKLPKFDGATLCPADGKEEITKAFIEERKLNVKVGESVPDIIGGFIIKDKRMEYDCSFKTLMKNLKEMLEPELFKLIGSGS